MLKIFEGYVKNDEDTMLRVHGYASTAGGCALHYGKPDIGKYTDVTAEYFVSDTEKVDKGYLESSADRLYCDLIRCGWGSVEAGYISELLRLELEKMHR